MAQGMSACQQPAQQHNNAEGQQGTEGNEPETKNQTSHDRLMFEGSSV
jgi:hypothetical protein